MLWEGFLRGFLIVGFWLTENDALVRPISMLIKTKMSVWV